MKTIIFKHFFLPLFLLTVLYACAAHSEECNKKELVCKVVCQQDGDDLGIIVNDRCYCANFRNVDKVVIRVANDFRTEKKKLWSWE